MPIASVIQSVIGAVTRSVIAVANRLRWAYSFDGVDDRGQLAIKAVNLSGDIDVEFSTGPLGAVSLGNEYCVLSQCSSNNYSLKEFRLYFNSSEHWLQAQVGSAYSPSLNGAKLKANTSYRWWLQGNNLKVFENGILKMDATFDRGTAREAGAVTVLGAETHGSPTTFRAPFLGSLYNLRVNGVLWSVDNPDSLTQLPARPVAPSITTVNNVNQASIAFPVPPYVDAEGYTVLTVNGTQSWSYAAFNIPVEPGMTYIVETIADFQGSNIFYGCQTNSSAGAIEIRNFLNMPANKISRQVVTALSNLNRPFMLITRNVPNNGVGVFRHKFLRAFPIGTRTGPQLVPNGDFATDVSGWTTNGGGSLAWSSGQAVLTCIADVQSRMERTVGLEAGQYYVATADISAISGVAHARLNMLRGPAGSYAGIQNAQVTSAGMRITNIFLAPATDALIQIVGDSKNAGTITVDNITLYKLTDVCNPLTLVNTASTGWQEIQP